MTAKPYREILDRTAGDRIPDDLNLLPGIAAQYQKQKGFAMKPLFRFALAGLLVLVVLAVVLITVPPVATAMRRVLGYAPGLGLVEQGKGLYVLAAPATSEREGVRFTVEKGSADFQRTILLVSVSGMKSDPTQTQECTLGSPKLRLTDGKALDVGEATGYGSDTGYTQRMVFPALPTGQNSPVLEVPCLLHLMPGKWPENWQIPLNFVEADPAQLAPVIEIPTAVTTSSPGPTGAAQGAAQEAAQEATTPASSTTLGTAPTADQAAEALAPTASGLPDYGISMSLEKVATLDDGYVLMGNMAWKDQQVGDYGVYPINTTLVDANGQPVSYEDIAPDSFPEPGSKQSYWAYKVHGKQQAWPLTLKASAQVTLTISDLPSFTVDLSNPPTSGQSQDLNLTMDVKGHTLRVLSYTTSKNQDGNAMLNFTMQSSPDLLGVSLFDVDHPVLGGGGGGGGGASQGPFTSGFTYKGPLPTGKVNISVTALIQYIDGGWMVNWQP
jgi:hypothetical protein